MRLALLLALGTLASNAATRVVTIAGLGGEAEYEQRFVALAQALDAVLKGSGPDVHAATLHGPQATKERFRQALEEAAKSSGAQDSLIVVLIGHGGFDGVDYKMNLPGPDLSATELAAMLDRAPAARQLVVNTTSASGGSIHALQKPGRTVITATRTGTEKNATVFARYWVEALRDPASDTDKNEVISAMEAFDYAAKKTKNFFDTQKRLATEHAAIDGQDASRFALLRLGSVQQAAKDPAKQALLARREELEIKIDDLKRQKAAMQADVYKKQLAALLLELARVQQEIDK